MLFDAVMHAHMRALKGFYADPTRSVMVLRVDPDLEYVAARFVAQLGRDDGDDGDESDAPLVFGISADFVEPAQFYREAAAQLAEALAPVRAAYGAEDPELVLPEGMVEARTWPPACALESRFAEYLERIARGLGNWHETVVFAVRCEQLDAARALASLTRLSGQLVGPAVKLVLFDDRRAPRLPQLHGLRTRYAAAWHDGRHGDGQGRLAAFVTAEDVRVLGLALHGRNLDGLTSAVLTLRDRGAPIVPVFVRAPFASRMQFGQAIYRGVLDAVGSGGLPERIHDARALDRPEASMIEAVERAIAGRGAPCVVVQPTTVRDTKEWARFVVELAAACARVETKFIVLDVDGTAPLPDAPAREAAATVHTFELGVEHTHRLLEDVLARPDLPVDVRIGHLVMLANVRVGQGRQAEAAELAAEGIVLAQTHGHPGQLSSSWWTLGYALQRAGNIEAARNAFCEATDAALGAGNFAGAAQGLTGIGHTYFLARDWAAAIRAYGLAREHWLDAGQVFGECQALIWIGESLRKAKQYQQADAQFAEVVARYRAMRAPFERMAEGGLADVYERIAANHADAGRRSHADAYRRLAHQHGSCGPVADQPA